MVVACVVLYLVVACVVISVVCMLQLVHFLCFVGSYRCVSVVCFAWLWWLYAVWVWISLIGGFGCLVVVVVLIVVLPWWGFGDLPGRVLMIYAGWVLMVFGLVVWLLVCVLVCLVDFCLVDCLIVLLHLIKIKIK